MYYQHTSLKISGPLYEMSVWLYELKEREPGERGIDIVRQFKRLKTFVQPKGQLVQCLPKYLAIRNPFHTFAATNI